MVSIMDCEQKSAICDSRQIKVQSAISHRAVDLQIIGDNASPCISPDSLIDLDLSRKTMKLDLKNHEDADNDRYPLEEIRSPKSPKSPLSNSSEYCFLLNLIFF